MKLKKINNQTVKPLQVGLGKVEDTRPIKGEALFPELYSNIFLCAKKKSGKTVCAGTIIKECATRDTIVMVFCPTLDIDENHKKIKEYCQKKKIVYQGFPSLSNDNGVNILKALEEELKEEARLREEEDSDSEKLRRDEKYLAGLFTDEEKEKKHRKNKYQSPDYIIFIDDLSDELRTPIVNSFVKRHRHYRIKTLLSSQYTNDLTPQALQQMDYCLIFKGIPEEKIIKLKRDFNIDDELEDLLKMYDHATEEKFNFLYIDIREQEYRKNFDKLFSL